MTRTATLAGIILAVILTALTPTADATPARHTHTTGYSAPTRIRTYTIASVTVTCYTRNRWDQDHWNDGTIGADEWDFRTKHYEFYCAWPNSADSVRMLKSTYSYNFEGDSQNCDVGSNVNVMKYIKFNSYFSDDAGRNFNPGPVAVTCSTRSYRAVHVYYDTDTHLWTSNGHTPRFRTNYDLTRVGLLKDTHHNGTHTGALRICSGRGFTKC